MKYTREQFELDWEAYEKGWTFATLDEAYEDAIGQAEAEADYLMERASEQYWENRGYDEARLQEQMEFQRGIF